MQLKNPFLFIFLLFYSFSFSAWAQNNSTKLGFALSGGGAKGIAHIGVLKVMEEEGIYPDFITGTSMGSIVGGLYATGYSAADLEKLAHQLEWSEFFNDNIDRSYLSIEEKRQADRYQVSFPFENGKVQLPKGLVRGQKMALLLSRLTVPVHDINNFDLFRIPFRCVATDLEKGEAVVARSGFLPDAIRASMSIPTVFEPVENNDKLLVDGGLVRNLPVQDALDMGADLVIALDVGGPLYSKDEFTSVLTVLEQTGSFMTEQSNLEQRALANLIISPDITGFSALSFEQIDTLISRGEQAARAMLPKIRSLLKNRKKTLSPFQIIGPRTIFQDSFLIQGIDFDVASKENIKTLKSLFQISLPKVVSLKKIEEELKKVYTSRFFKKIDYRLLNTGDGYILVIRAEEQGGNYLKASANYDSDYGGSILLNATIRTMLLERSKLSIDLRVSEKPALIADYLIYTPTRPNVGFRFSGLMNLTPGFFYEKNELTDEFDWRHGLLRFDVFTGISSKLSVSAGYGLEFISQNKKFFSLDSEKDKLTQQNVYFNINRDTYNRLNFPISGSIFSIKSKLVINGSLTEVNNMTSTAPTDLSYTLTGNFSKVFKLGPKYALHWFNYGGMQDYKNSDNLINLFYVGRSIPYEENYIPFFGYRFMEKPVSHYGISGLKLQVEPWVGKFVSFNFNYGYFKTPTYSFDNNGTSTVIQENEELTAGAGIQLGLLTSIGPANFSSEYNFRTNNFNFYLTMGYAF